MDVLEENFVDVDTGGCSIEEIQNLIKKVRDVTNKEPIIIGDVNKLKGVD